MTLRSIYTIPALALCVLVTGCAPTLRTPANDPAFTSHPMTPVPASVSTLDPGMTLEKAKTASLAMQDELVAFVPPEWIAERNTKQISYLGRCEPRRPIYQWSGRTRLILTGPHDASGIVEKIAQHYEAGTAFTAHRSIKGNGQPRVDLVGTDGSGYLVTRDSKDMTDIVIMADSPCFASDDVNLFDEY